MSKLTPKQEAFVQAYLKSGNQRQAYEEAYNAENMGADTIYVKACNLLKQDKIRIRLEELQERTAKKAERTVESIDEMMQTVYDKAIESDLASALPAAATAAMNIAKLHGLIINKSEDVTPRRSAKEVEARVRSLLTSGDAERTDGPAGRVGSSDEPGKAVPTVSGHGTA